MAYNPTFTRDRRGKWVNEQNTSLVQVVAGSDAYITEDEFNTMQWIMQEARADVVRQTIPSGVLPYDMTIGATVGSSAGGLGQIQAPPASVATPNGLNLRAMYAYLNGYKMCINRNGGSNDGLNVITLPAPPTSGTRDDLVFLEAWFQEVSSTAGSADTNLYNYGGVNSGNATNDILDGRIGNGNQETTRRVQLRWRIRTVAGVTFTSGADDGMNNIGAQGGGASPTTYGYSKASAFTGLPFASDGGLYVAGTGNSASQTALSSLDGYVYAIPLFRVKRRNNAGYSATNVNGARNYYALTQMYSFSSLATGASTTLTFNATDAANTQVGDVLYQGTNYTVQVIAVNGTSVTLQNIGAGALTSISTGYALANSYTNPTTNITYTTVGARPDGLYSNIIDSRDIVDLRHQVSLTGFNYDKLLRQSFDQYMRGELQTTADTKKTMNKEVFGLQKAPFGVAQTVAPTPVTGSDGVRRSLVNLFGTDGNMESANTATNWHSATVDSTTAYSGTKSVSSGYAWNTYKDLSTYGLTDRAYYVAVAMTKTNSTTQRPRINVSPAVGGGKDGYGSASSAWGFTYVAFQYDASAQYKYLYLLLDGTDGSNVAWFDNVALYPITSSDYTAITSGALNSQTAMSASFPYMDSVLPNFVENLIPPFTDPSWALASQATVTTQNVLTLNATAVGQLSSVTLPSQAGVSYTVSGIVSAGAQVNLQFLDGSSNVLLTAGSLVTSTQTSGTATAPTNTQSVKVVATNSASSGTLTFSNLQLEKNNTGIAYPNVFVPFGRWWLPNDYATNATKYLTQPNSFDGLRTNFSDAQISETKTDAIRALRTPQRHIKAVQATDGQWTANDTITVTSYYGLIDGVIDADTELAHIAYSNSTTQFKVDDVSKLAVNDTVNIWRPSTGAMISTGNTINTIDTTNLLVTVGTAVTIQAGDILLETTASSSAPVVKDSSGNTVAGTWTNLGTTSAKFTVTTAPATATSDLSLNYSVVYPAGQGLQYLPASTSDLLQASVNGQTLMPSTGVSVSANFLGKVVGSTDAVPHSAWVGGNSSLIVPSSFSSEFASSGYTSLSSQDGSSATYNSTTSGQQAQQMFKFDVIRAIEDKYGEIPNCVTLADKVAWVKANISTIKLSWWGYGSAPSSNWFHIAIWNGSAWTAINSASATSVTSWSNTYSGTNLTNNIDANGYAYFVAYADASDGTTASVINTDYVQLDITLTTAETGYTVFQPSNLFPVLGENLLNRNQAFPVDYNTSDFTAISAGTTASIDNSTGTSALKIVTDGSVGNQGLRVPSTYVSKAYEYYTVSLLVRGSGTINVDMFTDSYHGTTQVTLTNSWQLVQVSGLGTTAGYYVAVSFRTATSQVATIYATQMKIQLGAVATPWTAGRNKKFVLNYIGKNAGDTASNPSRAGWKGASTFPTPATSMFDGTIAGEVSTSGYNQLATQDGSLYYYGTSTSGQYAQQLFEFDLSHLGMSVTELKNLIRNTQVNWTGYGSGDNAGTLTYGATVKMWNASTSAWAVQGSTTASTPSTVSGSSPSNIYITNDQKVYVLVHSTYAASATNTASIYTDYINLVVTLADNVDYVKGNIVKVNPVSKEIKTMFPAKSNRYTGNGGQEDAIALWYNHLPVAGFGSKNTSELVTILAEISEWFVSDLGTLVCGAKQGTHQYQNPLYRLGYDRTDVFGTFGYGAIPFASDSKSVNTGAQVSVKNTGQSNYWTTQFGVTSILKYPMVGTSRYLVNHSGEIKLFLLSVYTNNGLIANNTTGVGMLVPLQGRPLTKEPQGAQRGNNYPTAWRTSEGMVEGFVKSDGTVITTYA